MKSKARHTIDDRHCTLSALRQTTQSTCCAFCAALSTPPCLQDELRSHHCKALGARSHVRSTLRRRLIVQQRAFTRLQRALPAPVPVPQHCLRERVAAYSCKVIQQRAGGMAIVNAVRRVDVERNLMGRVCRGAQAERAGNTHQALSLWLALGSGCFAQVPDEPAGMALVFVVNVAQTDQKAKSICAGSSCGNLCVRVC